MPHARSHSIRPRLGAAYRLQGKSILNARQQPADQGAKQQPQNIHEPRNTIRSISVLLVFDFRGVAFLAAFLFLVVRLSRIGSTGASSPHAD